MSESESTSSLDPWWQEVWKQVRLKVWPGVFPEQQSSKTAMIVIRLRLNFYSTICHSGHISYDFHISGTSNNKIRNMWKHQFTLAEYQWWLGDDNVNMLINKLRWIYLGANRVQNPLWWQRWLSIRLHLSQTAHLLFLEALLPDPGGSQGSYYYCSYASVPRQIKIIKICSCVM